MTIPAHTPARIEIPETFNVRDIGGWTGADGRRVRTGALYRADGLGRLTGESIAMMREMRIVEVIDLREERESANIPDRLDGLGAAYLHMPMLGNRYYPLNPADARPLNLPDRTLPTLYAAMIDHFGDRFVAVLSHLASERDGAAVFHCSAGKDRTGLVAAFLLTLLGVDRDDVIADYAATERFLGADFLAAITGHFASAGISADLATTATAAPPEFMDGALAKVEREHGGVEAYLRSHGLADAAVERLRAALLEG